MHYFLMEEVLKSLLYLLRVSIHIVPYSLEPMRERRFLYYEDKILDAVCLITRAHLYWWMGVFRLWRNINVLYRTCHIRL